MNLSALILAGGKGTRMDGEDKGLVNFGERRMIDWAVDLVQTFSNDIIISCNRNKATYELLSQKTVVDSQAGYLGPLVGVLSAMKVADSTSLLVLPCDTPCLQARLLERLLVAAKKTPDAIVVLKEGAFMHPLHAVIPVALHDSLATYLKQGGRSVKNWYQQHPLVTIEVLKDEKPMLANLNTRDALNRLQ